uniref:Putative secreted protein n=1 Tax=Anopheles darlingi TaxID=43151 RepID=A0A2M4D0S6_ANODA
MIWMRSSVMLLLVDLVIELSNMIRNCFSEFWYITFTLDISTIRKYRIDPRAATARNSSRAIMIFFSVTSEILSFWFTSSAVVFVSCSTSISASSSTSEPSVDVSRQSRLPSSSFMLRWFFITLSNSCTRSASSSDFSIKITRPSSWSSRPRIVTVKSMIDVLALISGLNGGFGSLVVMYSIKPGITSHSLSPTSTFSIEPDFIKFFSSTLSMTGSSSIPTSSISSGLPSERLSSRCVRKYL